MGQKLKKKGQGVSQLYRIWAKKWKSKSDFMPLYQIWVKNWKKRVSPAVFLKFGSKIEKTTMGKSSRFIKLGSKIEKTTRGKSSCLIKFGSKIGKSTRGKSSCFIQKGKKLENQQGVSPAVLYKKKPKIKKTTRG